MSRSQIFRYRKFILAYAVIAISLMSVAFLVISAKAGTETPAYITVEYNGNAILVDGVIDRSQLTVNAVYADGTQVEVTDYMLSTDVIRQEGTNTISVIYLGKTASFTVTGKVVVEIFPYYTGELISIDNAVDARNVSVFVSFSDNSFEQVYDFTLENDVVTEEGDNEVLVWYGGEYAEFTVEGREMLEVVGLFVTYTGDEVMLGNNIDRDKIFVTAAFEDGTVESIVKYDISTETPTMLGANTIVVSYGNKTATFILEGIARTIESLSAEYVGNPVEIGKAVRKSDIVVKAKYSDGVTEIIEDFDLPSPKIYFVGSHVKTVHYMGLTADIYVTGVEEAPTDYSNAAEYTATNGYRSATMRLAVPSGIDPGSVKFSTLKKIQVSKALTREVKRTNFIVFSIDASQIDEELPLEMKITVPEGLTATECVLYYTPNLTTTIGLMEYEITGENEITVLIYKSGNYILTCEHLLKRYLKKREKN